MAAALVTPIQAKEIHWAVRVHPGVLIGLTQADLAPSGLAPDEVVERLRRDDVQTRVGDFVALCVRKGVSEILMEGVQPELKGIYFRSPRLEQLGWVPLVDALAVLQEQAGKRGVKIGLVLSELGVHARGLYGADFGLDGVTKLDLTGLETVSRGLKTQYQLSSILEGDFPAAWIAPFERLATQLGFRYIRSSSADDLVNLTEEGQRTTPLAAFPKSLTLATRDESPLISAEASSAVTNGSLPLAVPSEKPPAIELTARSSGWLFLEGGAFFRAAQAAPDSIIWSADREVLERITPALLTRAQALADGYDGNAPRLDLVALAHPAGRLDAGQQAWLQLASNLEPIFLFAGAAGYRVSLTGEIRPDARAYYIYLAGNAVEKWKQAEATLGTIADRPVFVQFGSAPTPEMLRAVSQFLGLPQAEWEAGIPPPVGVFRGRQLVFKGIDLYGGRIQTGFLRFQAPASSAPVRDSAGLPLIWMDPKAPLRFFVNSNLIGRDVAYPLSNLITSGRALQAPAACFISVGAKSVFWALGDTSVDWINPRTGDRISLDMKTYGFYETP